MNNNDTKINLRFIIKKLLAHYIFFLLILACSVTISLITKNVIINNTKVDISTSFEIRPIDIKNFFNSQYPELSVHINNFNLDYNYIVSQIFQNTESIDFLSSREVNQNIFLEYFRSEVLLFNKKYTNDQLISSDDNLNKPKFKIFINTDEESKSLHDNSINIILTSYSHENNKNFINLFLDQTLPKTMFLILKSHLDFLEFFHNQSKQILTYYEFSDQNKLKNLNSIIEKNYLTISSYKEISSIKFNKQSYEFFESFIIKEKNEELVSTLSSLEFIIYSFILSIILYVFGVYIFYALRENINNL